MLHSAFIVLHLASISVWIGAAVTVGVLARAASSVEEPAAEGLARAAVLTYRRVATPAFGLAFVFGILLFLDGPGTYIRLHWFHAKLTAALAVIALHHVLGAKAKRSASGSRQAGSPGGILAAAIVASALAAIACAELKTSLVP